MSTDVRQLTTVTGRLLAREQWQLRWPKSGELRSVEKGLCRLQIGGVEPLREVVIDGLQNRLRVGGKVLIAQQLGKGYRDAQFRG